MNCHKNDNVINVFSYSYLLTLTKWSFGVFLTDVFNALQYLYNIGPFSMCYDLKFSKNKSCQYIQTINQLCYEEI